MEKVDKIKTLNKFGVPQCCIAHIVLRTVDESDFVLDALHCTLGTLAPIANELQSTWRNTRLLNRSIVTHMLPGLHIGEHKFNLLDDTHLDITIHSNNPVYFNNMSLRRAYENSAIELYMLRRNTRDRTYEVCDLLHNEWFKISSKPDQFHRLLTLLDPQWPKTFAWNYEENQGLSRDRQKLGLLLDRFDQLLAYVHSDACDRELCWFT